MQNRYFPFFELLSSDKETYIIQQNTGFHILTVLPSDDDGKKIKYWINATCKNLPEDFLEYKYKAYIKDDQRNMVLYILSKSYKELIVFGTYLQSKPRTMKEIEGYLKTKDFLMIHKNLKSEELLNTKTDDISSIIEAFYYHVLVWLPVLIWPTLDARGKFRDRRKQNRYHPEFTKDSCYIHTVDFLFPEYFVSVSHTDLKKLIETVETIFHNYNRIEALGDRDLENQRIIKLLEEEGLVVTKMIKNDE